MDRNYRVYSYTNQITNQKYIGKTGLRLQSQRAGHNGCHYVKYCSAFGEAIQQDGWENFKYEVIEEGLTKEEAEIKEREYIEKFNTIYPFGYNLEAGGNLCKKVHPITIQKWKEYPREVNGFQGKHHTDEWKSDHSRAVQGNTNTKGRKWYNNGIKDVMAYQSPGEEWKEGRLKYKSKSK